MLVYMIEILEKAAILWSLFCIAGYVYYKAGFAKTWAEGIPVFFSCLGALFKGIFHFFYKMFSKQALENEMLRTEWILTNQEVISLTASLKGCPYDTPSLEGYTPNIAGVLWVDISAVGLTSTYQNLPVSGIKEVTEKMIQNFYMQTRETRVPVYIKVASAKRLYFAVALSGQGKEFLDKQETEKTTFSPDEVVDLFTEEIPEEEVHDSGL